MSKFIQMTLFAGLVVLMQSRVSCVITPDNNQQELTMARGDALGDTVSVFPELQIGFSLPLKDSAVGITSMPPIAADHAVWLNQNRDTLFLRVLGVLEGNTRYVVRLDSKVEAENGSELKPEQDSIVFVTHPAESRQNSSLLTADTLVDRMFGVIEKADASDYFVPRDFNSEAFYIRSYSQKIRMVMKTADGSEVVSATSGENSDTLAVSQQTIRPYFLQVESGTLEAMQRYEIGVVHDP